MKTLWTIRHLCRQLTREQGSLALQVRCIIPEESINVTFVDIQAGVVAILDIIALEFLC